MLGDSAIAGAVGTRVCQSHIPMKDAESINTPCIWFAKQSAEYERTTDAHAGEEPFRHYFAVEVIDTDLNDAQTLADAVHSRLNHYRGAFDDSTVKGIFVTRAGDDYQTKSIPADLGYEIAAMTVEVVP